MSTETTNMTEQRLAIQPATIDEWVEEDRGMGVLGGPNSVEADEATTHDMLSQVVLTLPAGITSQDLPLYAAAHATELEADIRANSDKYDYRYLEVPLNILVPKDKLVRLRLILHLETGTPGTAVVHDLFPPDKWDVQDHTLGAIDLDISKALTFICPAPLAPLTEAIGFKINLPIKWQTVTTTIATTDRGANPAQWYVQDQRIAGCFTAQLIIRSPKGARVTLRAELEGELRRPFGEALLVGQFRYRQKDDAVYTL